MGVMATYPSDLNDSIEPLTHTNKHHTHLIMCKMDYEGSDKMKHLRRGQQPEGIPGIP
jgi:hypothetical protein